ncbi:hypothetical protein F4604DRAFT_1918608 [Suillus subluteus]|nr:hypothetical protein F4604DRAFT_1918608 [Suillus subluteus]
MDPQRRAMQQQRPSAYYQSLRKDLATSGRTAPRHAANTRRSKSSLLVKLDAFCIEMGEDRESFIANAQAEDLKTFLRWTLDRYPKVRASNSLSSYWRALKMYIVDSTGRSLDDAVVRDVLNYKSQLVDEYRLSRLPRKRGVACVDDIYHILFYHWAYDKAVYADEQQRVQVAAGILMASYFGCRPVSMFDTSLTFDRPDQEPQNESPNSPNHIKKSTRDSKDMKLDDESDESDEDETSDTRERRVLLWRHITFFVAPNKPGKPNLVFAKVTLAHTKGEDNNPRVKAFVITRTEDPLLCLVDHMLSMALKDEIFAATSIRDASTLFTVPIPSGKKSLTLHIKREAWDLPVFREPTKADHGYRTSATRPMRSSTWSQYLKRLGINVGMPIALTQYVFRRGLVNAINDKAPSNVRDQIFDHQSNAVRYYLDQEVRFDTQAAFLGRPSDETVQKLAHSMLLTIDATAPTQLPPKLKEKIINDKRVSQLCQKSRALTASLRHKYGLVKNAPTDDLEAREKVAVDAALHRTKERRRAKLQEKHRKQHFENADATYLDTRMQHDSIETKVMLPAYRLEERRQIVEAVCEPCALSEEQDHGRRVEAIHARVALSKRQESRYCRVDSLPVETKLLGDKDSLELPIPLVCLPTQCIFCLGNKALPLEQRLFTFCRKIKMMEHIERAHLAFIPVGSEILCPHPLCKAKDDVEEKGVKNDAFVSWTHFKNHVATVHGIHIKTLA